MKAIELSEAKARELIRFLAPQWASEAVKLAALKVPRISNHPLHLFGSGKQKDTAIADARSKLKLFGDLLAQLGCALPAPDVGAVHIPYGRLNKDATGNRARIPIYMEGKAKAERARVVEAIIASASAGQ